MPFTKEEFISDSLPIEPGVLTISGALNGMKPLRGASNRKSKAPILYTEEEFEQETGKVLEKYQGQFFKEVEFMEKKDFCEKYGSQGYFRELT